MSEERESAISRGLDELGCLSIIILVAVAWSLYFLSTKLDRIEKALERPAAEAK